MDIWLILYALAFLFAFPRIKWHRRPSLEVDPETRYLHIETWTQNGLLAYKWITTPPDKTSCQPITIVSAPADWLVGRWISEQVASRICPAGNWTFYLYCDYCSVAFQVYFRIFKRNSAGGETLYKTTGSYTTGTSSTCPGVLTSFTEAVPEIPLVSTDCIVIEIHATGTAGFSRGICIDYTTCNSRIDSQLVLPPTAPTNCSVSVLSETSLRVSWTDASTDEDDFHVERKTGAGGTYAEVQVVASTTKTTTGTVYTWDNSGLLLQTTYYYHVRAHRHSDNIYSNYSNEAYATTPFYAPTNLVAIALNIDAILVQWNDNSQNESDYHLERKTSLEPTWAERTILPANSTQFTDPGLDPAIIYTYKVRAHNHAQDIYTTYSNEASEAPKLLAQIPFNPFTPLLGYY